MLIVSRYVRPVKKDGDPSVENPTQSLEDFRDQAAWILLGEPGAGKSSVFEHEAKAHGGIVLSVAEFLEDLDADWQGRTLFLDGLDETRAGGGDDRVLFKIRSRLKKLGNPSFRIACRAADWFGSTDREAMAVGSPDGELPVLLLEPLGEQDILDILRSNHGVEDPEAFVHKASEQCVDGLLSNPQTLGLLAQAVRVNSGPRLDNKHLNWHVNSWLKKPASNIATSSVVAHFQLTSCSKRQANSVPLYCLPKNPALPWIEDPPTCAFQRWRNSLRRISKWPPAQYRESCSCRRHQGRNVSSRYTAASQNSLQHAGWPCRSMTVACRWDEC